ncbi:DNA polymerase III subunit epsilon [Acidomonas methanolica]|uniref:DNA polymerase III subunit epsilon n=1 Tax=Acidomonas methanolica NBRC 104435 TaxID=1231351 RepID=A0A023D4A0_ACIMT|nr:DNA polymerase III subunit epsilon [Acidomonas methanolica]MBU2653240.1 DNA polymerase III subunit epsilon [Acidomonas methanolica]TCS32189.1 DNA polymerase-3 subunit epsilon [Acidomonas methanolica]GAJ28993.1 DNA polymerase III subunit epsilon [Acidomonas methanolica NBRC 104435]GBQ52274.1 DNA polymerase III subunit epsilon [Acidomonas methanolica]GEK97623.1 DNA polymerase III subunit epsilon [Acidomonas methanolica NBRC 104435]
MKRSILFDTETTGLDPASGDRVIEIAALELVDDLPTGNHYHTLVDPERDVPAEATRVHGFTREDLHGQPKFAEVAQGFLDFVQGDPLIAHNARFDFGFLNAELAACGLPPLESSRMVDTLEIAKKRFPGLPNSLDALCRRFEIDLSARTTHNALLDCKLLAEVYVELMGGRQRGLGLMHQSGGRGGVATYVRDPNRSPRRMAPPSAEEDAAHAAFVGTLKEPIWLR